MPTFLNVSPEEIATLTDTDFRELIARLAQASVKRAGYSTASVVWGGDQRAADGGIDVEVKLDKASKVGGYIPRPNTGYQVKAEDFPRSKIVAEMKPGGKLRPSIVELSKNKGAYVIASSKGSLSNSALKTRLMVMKECVETKGRRHTLIVDFYDRQRIATWVEEYPSLVAWLKERCGSHSTGWKSFGPWAYMEESAEAEYVLDNQVKVFTPSEEMGISARDAANKMRSELALPKASLRLVGLSGVGKTRLIQALFDDRLETKAKPLDRNGVIYTDLSDNPAPQPVAMVEALASAEATIIVVVDNCGAQLHQRLSEIVKRSSTVRLITAEYDIREDLPEGTSCYRLEPSSDELIVSLVHRRYPALSKPDVERIVEFSGGNARVAFALAATSNRGGELASLQDEALFRRMFDQQNAPSDELLRCAEVCALLYSFNGDAISGRDAELPLLADLAEVHVPALVRHMAELRRRGLVQTRGIWRAVLPHAIANRLASRSLQNIPMQSLLNLLQKAPSERIGQSFSRRLGYLHDSAEAQRIVSSLFEKEGLLFDLSLLGDFGLGIFKNVAPVRPRASLDALLRATKLPEFVSTENYFRSQFARVARQIAYDRSLFENAVDVLLAFSLADKPNLNHNSTRDLLISLFQIHLSGTAALPEERATVVRRLLSSTDATQQMLGVASLGAALKTSHFSPAHEFEFGAHKRDYGWYPRNPVDVRKWFTMFLGVAKDIGGERSETGRQVRAAVGDELGDLCLHAAMFDVIEELALKFKQIDGWPEGWIGVRRAIHFSKSEKTKSKFTKIDAILRPQDLATKVRARIFAKNGYSAFDFENEEGKTSIENRWVRARREAEQLGQMVAGDEQALSELMSELTTLGSGLQEINFGKGLGSAHGDPESLLAKLRLQLSTTPIEKANMSCVVGIIDGIWTVRPAVVQMFLDEAVEDDVWGAFFPLLQTSVPLDENAVKRLKLSLVLGLAPLWTYRTLGTGRVTDHLAVPQISQLIDAIRARPNGQVYANDVLHMVIFGAGERGSAFRDDLARYARSFVLLLDWAESVKGNDSEQSALEDIVNLAVEGRQGKDVALSLISTILSLRNTTPYISFYRCKFLVPLFKHHPKSMLDVIFVPDKKGKFGFVVSLLGGREYRRALIDEVSDEVLLSWCSADPGVRLPFVAQCCRIFSREDDDISDKSERDTAWTPLAMSILHLALDKAGIMKIFAHRAEPMSWSGSRALIIYKRASLFLELVSDQNLEIAEAAKVANQELLETAKREELWEQKREESRNERFE